MTGDKSAILDLIKSNPELTFSNNGYEELNKDILDRNKDAIEDIEKILASKIPGFIRFQNFKIRSNGDLVVRYQVRYSDYFVGVSYNSLESIGLGES